MAENMQAHLKKNLGINLELHSQEFKGFIKAQRTNPSQIMRYGWAADYMDPSVFLTLFRSTSLNNYSRWKNAKYDQVIDAAEKVKEPAALYRQAQKILIEDDAVVVPLFTGTSQFLISPRVQGFQMNSLGSVDLSLVSVTDLR